MSSTQMNPTTILNQGLILNDYLPADETIVAWEGITMEQVTELIEYTEKRKEDGGEFHSWCRHKKSGKIYDDYTNPETKLGKTLKEIMELHNCDELEYVEFEKIPKYLEQLLSDDNTMWKLDWFKKYKYAQDYSASGFCFQRAHLKHKSSKNWKIKFGEIFILNKKTGVRLNIEGSAEDDLIRNHITRIRSKFVRGLMTEEKAFELITFFNREHLEIRGLINSWKAPPKSKYQNRNKIILRVRY